MPNPGQIGGSVFIFGAQPGGFAATFFVDQDGNVNGKVIFDDTKQGPPGHAHGGALATLIDEAMGAAAWNHGHRVLAANLNFNYRRPVPLNVEVAVQGRVERVDGRKIHTSGAILLPDGTPAVEGTGLFIEAPQYFGSEGFNPFMADSFTKSYEE
jgi:uncharacterized protein (TIGR00369 family)